MTEAHAIRCPRCGAYITEEIPETASYVKCPYCNTTLLIPKKEAHQQIQPVAIYIKDYAEQIKKHRKRVEEMTIKELEEEAGFFKEADEERVKELEEKKSKEGLTDKEEREN